MSDDRFDVEEALRRTFAPHARAYEAFASRVAPGVGAAALANAEMMLFRLFAVDPTDVPEESLQLAAELGTSPDQVVTIFQYRALAHHKAGEDAAARDELMHAAEIVRHHAGRGSEAEGSGEGRGGSRTARNED
jgi:hypothetical protein